MELRHVEAFLAVAEELHFGRAAARLRLTQARVSQLIRELEREVGTDLFERSSRRVALTGAGTQLREPLALGHRQLTGALRAAADAARTLRGRLRIGHLPGLGGHATQLAATFEARHTNCEVMLHALSLPDALIPHQVLADGLVDAVLSWAPDPVPQLTPETAPEPEPAAKPAPEAAPGTAAQPVAESVVNPVAKPVPGTAAEAVPESAPDTAAEPAAKRAAKPAPGTAAEPVAKPMAEPVAKPTTEPAAAVGGVGVGAVLASYPRAVLMPVGHPLTRLAAVALDDLADHVLINPSNDVPGELKALWTPQRTPSGRPLRYTADDMAALAGRAEVTAEDVMTLVARGRGLYITVDTLPDRFRSPGLVLVPIEDMPPKRVVLLWSAAARGALITAFARSAEEGMPRARRAGERSVTGS